MSLDHLLQKTDRTIDFNRLHEIVKFLCCEGNGHPSVDPAERFKSASVKYLYDSSSL